MWRLWVRQPLETAVRSLSRSSWAVRALTRGGPGGPPPPLFRTLRDGLGRLVSAVSQASERTNFIHKPVETIERTSAGFRLRLGGQWLEADQVVLACEAHQASRIIAEVDARISGLLGSIG